MRSPNFHLNSAKFRGAMRFSHNAYFDPGQRKYDLLRRGGRLVPDTDDDTVERRRGSRQSDLLAEHGDANVGVNDF